MVEKEGKREQRYIDHHATGGNGGRPFLAAQS
jgi:hypothetical protein